MHRVVISGLGVVSPLGIGKENFWNGLVAGRSATKHLSQVTSCKLFEGFDFISQVIAEVEGFDPEVFKLPKDVYQQDRYIQFALAGAFQALQDAHLDVKQVDRERFGIALSTAICGTRRMEEEFIKVTNYGRESIDPTRVGHDLFLASMSNTPAIILSALTGAQGPCTTLSTGCIGGLDAIGYAFESIYYGDADVMIAGASEAPITPITIAAFEVIQCLTKRHNQQPHRASRPFDNARDGFTLAEGCGIVVLEELEHARRRGAPIYAEITGFANTCNALHMTDLLSDGTDLARAMQLSITQSGIEPTDISFVNAHASSTRQNDSCETSALKLALGEHAYTIPINATKSMLGHALSSASAMEVVVCALSFVHNFVHPTINYEYPDPQCDLDYVPETGRKWTGDVLLTDASGFSGLHTAMIIRTPPQE
jgi:3-oxoacyl-(acyl-carrier-protein) synthase